MTLSREREEYPELPEPPRASGVERNNPEPPDSLPAETACATDPPVKRAAPHRKSRERRQTMANHERTTRMPVETKVSVTPETACATRQPAKDQDTEMLSVAAALRMDTTGKKPTTQNI